MTFEEFYKSLREGKSLTNDKGMTYVHLEDGVPVIRVSETNKIARTSPRIDFPTRGIVENETGYKVYEKPILDEVEKKYLSAVIKPFRDRITYIAKVEEDIHWFYWIMIRVDIRFLNDYYDFCLPPFEETSDMYKKMEVGKEYTLEELGL